MTTFTPKKPMLADKIENQEDWAKIKYPVYVSPKLDGVRCLVDESGFPYSRKGERFANPVVNLLFQQAKENGFDLTNLDGEFGMGDPTAKDFFSKTSGWLRRETGGDVFPHDLTFWIFDRIAPGSFQERFMNNRPAQDHVITVAPNFKVRVVEQHFCDNEDQVNQWESHFVSAAYEGLMLRGDIKRAEYKHGRASLKSQQLLKVKRFQDTEGVIVGFEPEYDNQNVAEKDAFGHTKRSGKQENLVALERVGVILVQCPDFTETVRIGTGIGLTHKLKEAMWKEQDKYIGRTVTFTYQAGSDYVKPRFPSMKTFRDDMI